jgi:uncharacterized protein with HEPN domain
LSRDWRLYLEDISSACAKIESYIGGIEAPGFLPDTVVFDAVLQNLMVIGEAAKRVPEDIRTKMPSVPWRALAGLRDVVAHGYFSLDADLVWDVAKNKAPILKRDIDRFLST